MLKHIVCFPDGAFGWKAGGRSAPSEPLAARGLPSLRDVAVVFPQRAGVVKLLLRFLGGSSCLCPLSDPDESFPDSV